MNNEIDKLAQVMNLTEFQVNVLKENQKHYKLSGLVKRGCALYAPRVMSQHKLIDFLLCIFVGQIADLIGENKMLVTGKRKIDFRTGGFYSAPVGRIYRYYADTNGNIITRNTFFQKTSLHN